VVPLSLHDAWFFDGLTPGGATWHYNGHRWSRVRSGNALTQLRRGRGNRRSATIAATTSYHTGRHSKEKTSVIRPDKEVTP